MKWIFVQDKRRFEGYSPDGRLVAVAPLPDGDVSDLPPNVIRGTPPPELVEYARRFLGGDTAAGDELAGSLADWNERFNQATTREQQRAAAAPASGQGALLPSPERLSVELDILQNAIDLTDATEKLSQKEAQIAAEARRLGVPFDPATIYGSGVGDAGPFPTTEAAISEVAATNPAYLAVLNRINNMAGVTELNRRQNALARFVQGLEQRGRDVDLNTKVSAIQQAMRDLDFDARMAEEDIIRSADASEAERALNRLTQTTQRKRQALQREMDDLIEAERPGWKAWQEEGKRLQAFMSRPEVRDVDNATRDALVQGFVNGTIKNPDEENARTAAAQGLGIGLNPPPTPQIPTITTAQPAVTPTAPPAPPAPMVTSLGSPYAGVAPPAEKAPDEMTPEEREAWERRRREQERELSTPRFATGGVWHGDSTRAGVFAPTMTAPALWGSSQPAVPRGSRAEQSITGGDADTMAPMPAWTSRQVQASLMGRARQIQGQEVERQQVREAFAREKAAILNQFEQQKAALMARWQSAVATNPFVARVYNPMASATTITPPAITYQPPAA